MNFDAFWQTHRRFILGLAGSAIAFFILLAMLTAGPRGEVDGARRAIARANREMSDPMYGATAVRELRTRMSEMEERNARLAESTLPPFREEYRVPPQTPASQHYIEVTGRVRRELTAWALRNDCEVEESLGLPASSPTGGKQIEQVLRGLDVVERVVRLAVDAGAVEVDKIAIADRNRRRAGRAQQLQLDVAPVTMEIVFQRTSPTGFVRALLAEQDGGRPLGLVGMEILPEQARGQERRVLLEFSVGRMPAEETADAEAGA